MPNHFYMDFLQKTLFVLLLAGPVAPAQTPVYNTAKPWTYWWWMGSAVNPADLTRQLEQFKAVGIGGVHVIPIYGVKGSENQFLPFLGEKWLGAFGHTVREAKRLGLGVDVTTGTGWPFGGPNVTADMAAKKWAVKGGKLVAVPTGQQVKRPAPGGEGRVVDPFSKSAVQRYLTRFDSTLARLPDRPRAVYNDSYEAFGANFSERFLQEFKTRRGYDLADQLAAFLDTTSSETAVRVKQDYHETLADLLREGFTETWTDWARAHGYRTRNQAHGSPGNLLDLYALADIPETESFGSSQFPIPGLRVDEGYEPERFGTPHPLAMKFASSAAHLLGKPLVSSETTTWLADHFKVSLAQIKPQVDELFTAGINHVFFHGTTYSPAAAPWPGWLFYASTHYGPTSHFYPHLPLLTKYIERCQTRLQATQPDNHVLVYFPMHDLWAKPAKSGGGVHQLEVHHVDRWLLPLPFGRLCEYLTRNGLGFDYVSDRQLTDLRAGPAGQLLAAGGRYRVLVVPEVTYLPEATAQRLLDLARQGVTVVFVGKTPALAPGFREAEARGVQVQRLMQEARAQPSVSVVPTLSGTLVGQLWWSGGLPEGFVPRSRLAFIRRKSGDSLVYFIANLTNRAVADSVQIHLALAPSQTRARRYDPLTDRTEELPVTTDHVGIRLEPGESLFLTIFPGKAQPVVKRPAATPAPLTPTGPWHLDFPVGAPYRPAPQTLTALRSWVLPGDTTTGWFSGTGRYRLRFSLPAGFPKNQALTLDLGDVREVAEVRLNGRDLGTAWCLPFRVAVPPGLLRAENTLEIRVTNLSANRVRFLDQKKIPWKNFYDINLVDIRYRPFDASRAEPVPSGLLGPVWLLALP